MESYAQTLHPVKTRRQRRRGQSSVSVSITTSQRSVQEYLVGISIRRNDSTLKTDLQIVRASSPERAWLQGYVRAQTWVDENLPGHVRLFIANARRRAAA